MKSFCVAACKPGQWRPRRLKLQITQLLNLIGAEPQQANTHPCGTAQNPCGDAGRSARSHASLAMAKGKVDQVIRQIVNALVEKLAVLRFGTALELELAQKEPCLHGIAERLVKTERGIPINKLPSVGGGIDLSGYVQIIRSVKEDANVEK